MESIYMRKCLEFGKEEQLTKGWNKGKIQIAHQEKLADQKGV